MFNERKDKELLNNEQEITIEEDIIAFHKEYDEDDQQKLESLKKSIKDVILNKETKLRDVSPLYRVAASFLIFILISGTISYYFYNTYMAKKEYTIMMASRFFLPENDEFLNEIIIETDLQRNLIEENKGTPYHDDKLVESLNKNLLLMEAVSDMSDTDLNNARKKLEKLYHSSAYPGKPAIMWYYGLLCAKEGNYRESMKVFNKVKEDNNHYSPTADSILLLLNTSR